MVPGVLASRGWYCEYVPSIPMGSALPAALTETDEVHGMAPTQRGTRAAKWELQLGHRLSKSSAASAMTDGDT